MIEEILTVQATIQAAEIQASATKYAAAIGGLAIAVGVIVSWLTTLHLQKVARLAETRKNVYLEVIEAYSNLIKELELILLDINGKWPSLINLLVEFSKKVDKTLFICETKNKDSIISFVKLVMDTFESFGHQSSKVRELAEELHDLSNDHSKIMGRFEEAAKYLQKVKIENPDPQKIQIVLDYFNEQLKESGEHRPLINQKEKELNDEIAKIQPSLYKIINDLNEKALPVTHLLRKELGAKSNAELDMFIYSKYKQE